jgi:hypothetical protein
LCLGADGGRVVGQFIDRDEDELESDPSALELAFLALIEQNVVAAVHLRDHQTQLDDGRRDVRADEDVGALTPEPELDPLAVQQHQAAIERQGGMTDDQVQRT